MTGQLRSEPGVVDKGVLRCSELDGNSSGEGGPPDSESGGVGDASLYFGSHLGFHRASDVVGKLLSDSGADCIDKSLLHGSAVSRLRSMIVAGYLPPGSIVKEAELCKKFTISRTPVREAIRILCAEGLMVADPYRGCKVGSVSETDIKHFSQFLYRLECEAAVTLISAAQWPQLSGGDGVLFKGLNTINQDLIEHHKRGRLADYLAADNQFHHLLTIYAGNPYSEDSHRAMLNKNQQAHSYLGLDEGRWKECLAEHEACLDALESGDGREFLSLLSKHNISTIEALLIRAVEREHSADKPGDPASGSPKS